MRDETHAEHVERWARFVKAHPRAWKRQLKPFIDAQIILANRFYARLAKTKGGMEKIRRLRELRSHMRGEWHETRLSTPTAEHARLAE